MAPLRELLLLQACNPACNPAAIRLECARVLHVQDFCLDLVAEIHKSPRLRPVYNHDTSCPQHRLLETPGICCAVAAVDSTGDHPSVDIKAFLMCPGSLAQW